ncbi:hypothetical protein RSAG8_11351, partial [Rhizoctonia solani AG-8 WAC10335]
MRSSLEAFSQDSSKSMWSAPEISYLRASRWGTREQKEPS